MQNHSDLLHLPVIGTNRGGKRRYDPQAKQKLIEACLQPGVSLAGLALKHGVNANLLRKWVVKHLRQSHDDAGAIKSAASAFVPVIATSGEHAEAERPMRLPARAEPLRTSPSRLTARLPNGVTLELACTGQESALVSAVIESLGRCHVPASR